MSDIAPGVGADDAVAFMDPPDKKVEDNCASAADSSITKINDKAKKEKQQVDWARVQKIDSVLLDADKDEFLLMGGTTIKNWTSKMLPTFCR